MAYKKQQFVDKQTVLKAQHLDHMENGILGNETKILKVQEHTDNISNALENTVYAYQKVKGDVISIPENLHFSKKPSLLRSIETEAYEGSHILTPTGFSVDVDGNIMSIPESITNLPNYGYGAGGGYNNTVDFENGKYIQRCNVFEPMQVGSVGDRVYFIGFDAEFPLSRYAECVKAIETVKCNYSELTFEYSEVTQYEDGTISSGMLRVKFNGEDPTVEALEEFIGRQRANNQPVVVCYGLFDPIVTDIPKVDIEIPVNPCSGVDFDGAVGEIEVFIPKNFVDNSFVETKCANALRGNLSGVAVSVNDVSPFEHELDIKVSSKNLFDISKVGTYKAGGSNSAPCVSGYGIINNGDGTLTVYTHDTVTSAYLSNNGTLRDFAPDLKVGETYTLKAKSIKTNGKESVAQRIYLNQSKVFWNFGKSLTITEEMLSSRVHWYVDNATGEEQVATISDIQIEKGTSVAEYAPYIESVEGINVTVTDGENSQTATANAEGIVKGLMSLAPNMTITTDNASASVECGYVKDTNKVIENLINAIISLGGNI